MRVPTMLSVATRSPIQLILRKQIIAASASSNNWKFWESSIQHKSNDKQHSTRGFHKTSAVFKKKKDVRFLTDEEIRERIGEYDEPGEDGILTLNAEGYTREEMRRILDEEYERLEREEQEKRDAYFAPRISKTPPRKPLKMSYKLEDFEREYYANELKHWNAGDKRCGALGVKLGMLPVWDDWGERHPCTVLHIADNIVLSIKTKESHGYDAIQLGAGERKKKRVPKPQWGIYKSLNIPKLLTAPPYIIREFRVNHPYAAKDLVPGQAIRAPHFLAGQNVDVSAISKGKGFQGAMKRHNFKGMPASHGVSKTHRALGSTGMCQDPGRVFKGKKMAGRMGGDRVTTQNLRIVKIDPGLDLLYVKGAVPGNKGEFVEIRDAIKRPLFGTDKVLGAKDLPPLPTWIPTEEDIEIMMMPLPQKDPFIPEEEDFAA